MSWFVYRGRVERLWYPVFPSNEDAQRVVAWLNEQLRYFLGIENDGVIFRRERDVGVDELAHVFASSGIQRPHQESERLSRMLRHANLMVTARIDGRLIGIARCLSDFAWCCYVSDLAVVREHQRRGLGRRLLATVQQVVGDQCSVILNAGPGAEGYYGHVGFEPVGTAWKIERKL